MSESYPLYYLKIKAQKVQSFIFKIPRLKTMLGANSLLGEFFANDLQELMVSCKFTIPQLWTDYVEDLELSDFIWENDDIKANFEKGVICSAGGHFESFFASKEDGESFINQVHLLASQKIPGVKLSITFLEYSKFSMDMNYKDFCNAGKELPVYLNNTNIYFDNPYFKTSSEDGELPEMISNVYDQNKKPESLFTQLIKKQGDAFYNGTTQDFLCCFQKEIKASFPELNIDKNFKDLDDLRKVSQIPSNNKIAIIAIDGNAMGDRFKKIKNDNKSVFDAMIDFEKFWFDQRNSFRIAIKNAFESLNNKPEIALKEYSNFPFLILMMGGDDLLLVTVPELAIPFTNCFCKAIKDKNDAITVSAGIAIIKYSYPFVHGHQLAESLLSSAKIKSRLWIENHAIPTYRNALDWHIHFTSGIIDIEEIRRKNYFIEYGSQKEILTLRPYTIEEAMTIWGNSEKLYQSINQDLDKDNSESVGRNKYKRLRTLLKSGEKKLVLLNKILKFDVKDIIKTSFNKIIYNQQEIKTNNALDVIELMDFHKREK